MEGGISGFVTQGCDCREFQTKGQLRAARVIKTSHIRAPIPRFLFGYVQKKPVKVSFSVRVENKPYFSSVHKNKAEMYLVCWLLMAIEARLISP